MPYKLQFIERIEKPPYIRHMGDYNLLPAPYTEVEMEEFIKMISHYTPSYVEFRQVHLEDERYIKNVEVLYFSDVAYAIVFPCDWYLCWKEEGKYDLKYRDKIRIFKCGCKHDYVQIEGYGCYKKYECTKCGSIYAVDSSD